MEKHNNVNGKLEQLRKKLEDNILVRRKEFWGGLSEQKAAYLFDRFWIADIQTERVKKLQDIGMLPGDRILDLAAGYGHFVHRAVERGYDCFGVEPDQFVVSFAKERFAALGLPLSYSERIVAGVGEDIPFGDGAFHFVVSYQTLEHVKYPYKVLAEMIRVARVGGGVYIRCPDYRSTFEAHYYLPWFPLFPRVAAKAYLRMLGRPEAGLDTIQYVTKPKILGWLSRIEKERECRLMVIDIDQLIFQNALRRRHIPYVSFAFSIYRFWEYIKALGRREINVNLFIRILEK